MILIKTVPRSSSEIKVQSFPLQSMLAAAGLTLTLFLGAVWIFHHLFMASFAEAKKELHLHQNIGRVADLDEVLTLSARLAAATGDPRWEARYRFFEPQLDACIDEIAALAPEAFASSSSTDQANQALVRMENEAFRQVRSGHLAEAERLLAGQTYREQKSAYAAGMTASVRAVEQHTQLHLAKLVGQLRFFGAGALIILALLALVWWHIFRLIGNYLAIAADARAALVEANRNLETRVLDRTAEISAGKRSLEDEINRRQAAEIELIRAQKLEAVGRLASGIAHEINTPIQFIGDNCRFLQESIRHLLQDYIGCIQAQAPETFTPELRAMLAAQAEKIDLAYLQREMPDAAAHSLEGVQRVAEIVRAMKEFAHPDAKNKSAADINKIIENAVLISRNEWKHTAEIVRNFDRTLPPISCLAGDLGQVFLNLIINASHAIAEKLGTNTQAKGTITLATRLENDAICIAIEDTGAGIPACAQPHIFTPFFTTKEVGRGTGQGLAIARNVIVEKHQGAITFTTAPGVGTTFLIQLPLSPCDSAAEPG